MTSELFIFSIPCRLTTLSIESHFLFPGVDQNDRVHSLTVIAKDNGAPLLSVKELSFPSSCLDHCEPTLFTDKGLLIKQNKRTNDRLTPWWSYSFGIHSFTGIATVITETNPRLHKTPQLIQGSCDHSDPRVWRCWPAPYTPYTEKYFCSGQLSLQSLFHGKKTMTLPWGSILKAMKRRIIVASSSRGIFAHADSSCVIIKCNSFVSDYVL